MSLPLGKPTYLFIELGGWIDAFINTVSGKIHICMECIHTHLCMHINSKYFVSLYT